MMESEQLEAQMTSFIRGELLHIIYENEMEHFRIAKIKVLDSNEEKIEKEVVIKGHFSHLQKGAAYVFYGQLVHHAKFGLQYDVESFQTYIPETKEGLIAYLSSDLFYGVGKRIAKKIVDHLGENAISKIMDDPDILLDVPGLQKTTAESLYKTLRENQGFEQVVVALAKYGIGLKMSQKIFANYKEQSIEILEADPYQYVFDIEGFGFQSADEIAKQQGLPLTHPNRVGAGCVYVLQTSIQEGHVYLPVDECIAQALKLLATSELSVDDIMGRLIGLNEDQAIVLNDNKVYLPQLYFAEAGFAGHLKRIIAEEVTEETTLAELMKYIGDIEEAEALSYGEEQFNAIQMALESKVMILTGGPGTGKTTVIKGIIQSYAAIHDLSYQWDDYEEKSEFPFILAAPTGRAAKRLQESTNIPARTIHRLLGWNGKDSFDKNEDERLSGKVLIIDEFSMVDIWLANSLFKAIPSDMQVLIVGDEEQLPSVGPGQVLSDLLASGVIPSITLEEVYRQKEGSKIIQLAHHIKNNTCTVAELQNDRDFSFIPCYESQLIPAITTIFERAQDKGIDVRDIQVLAPIYRSRVGINEINKHLQEIVNPYSQTKRQKKVKDVVFRVGDKVIQLVNQPEDGVSNGDIGEIVAIFEENENKENVEQIVIAFDDREVVYERKDYINFMHAYCISIHKSQGSEFPIVLMPVFSAYHRMLKKNLLYTGITRSKQTLILCGDPHVFIRGVETLDTNQRYTSLIPLLNGEIESDLDLLEIEEDNSLSPYDFM